MDNNENNKISKCKNGCNKPVKRIGLCSSCYNKYLKELKIKNGQVCCIDGCNDIEFAKGYCSKHYKRVYKNKDVNGRTSRDKNEYIIYDDYAEIILYNNKQEEVARTIIDIDDVDLVKQYKWHFNKGYTVNKSSKNILQLHRFIMDAPQNMVVDHIDRNPLNNRKNNLRICSQSKNVLNKNIPSDNTSGVMGVSWHKQYGKWETYITINKNRIRLGYFDDIEKAKEIRRKAEIKYFGEFAPVNVEAIDNE